MPHANVHVCQSRFKDTFAPPASELQLGLEEVTCPLPLVTFPFARPPAQCQTTKMIRNEALIQLSVKLGLRNNILVGIAAVPDGPTGG